MLVKIKRIVSTTLKDIVRNKSVSFSSISVMSLVFLVFSIFVLFAFSSYKVIRYIETRVHLEVFFKPGTDETRIMEIKKVLEDTGKTEFVDYTSQEEAAEYLKKKYSDNPLILGATTPEALPASLAIKAKKIDFVPELDSIVKTQDPTGEFIYKIGYNKDATNTLKDLLFWVRLIGGVLFIFLIIIIFLVSLITVELSIATRREEISIMQLVGGDNWFIRAPFILQGATYGILGSAIAFLIILSAGIAFYFLKDQSPTLSFISTFFSEIDWPRMNLIHIFLLFLAQLTIGGTIGSINSFIAVFRKIR